MHLHRAACVSSLDHKIYIYNICVAAEPNILQTIPSAACCFRVFGVVFLLHSKVPFFHIHFHLNGWLIVRSKLDYILLVLVYHFLPSYSHAFSLACHLVFHSTSRIVRVWNNFHNFWTQFSGIFKAVIKPHHAHLFQYAIKQNKTKHELRTRISLYRPQKTCFDMKYVNNVKKKFAVSVSKCCMCILCCNKLLRFSVCFMFLLRYLCICYCCCGGYWCFCFKLFCSFYCYLWNMHYKIQTVTKQNKNYAIKLFCSFESENFWKILLHILCLMVLYVCTRTVVCLVICMKRNRSLKLEIQKKTHEWNPLVRRRTPFTSQCSPSMVYVYSLISMRNLNI